jgi:hypothetical protein
LALVEIDIFTNGKTLGIIGDLRIGKPHIHSRNTEAVEKSLPILGHADDKEGLISKVFHSVGRSNGPS